MSLIYDLRHARPGLLRAWRDYSGEMRHFLGRVGNPLMWIPMLALKSIEWSIYRWYKTPLRRFYGIKSNELIYMITNACNDRCPKCAIWERPEPRSQRLDVADFLRCLERLHHNLYQVTLTGGEPLLFKRDVVRIADAAHRLDVPMVMVSNGRMLDEEFLTRYKRQGHVLVISVDSVRREKWNEFRGTVTFDLVMPKIAMAHRILGDQLRIQSVLSAESRAEVQEVAAWCRDRGIRHNVQLYQDFGARNWTYAVPPAEMVADDTPCAARKNICVYPNGDVVKCFDHRRIPVAREPLGNIARQDILEILCTRRSTEVSRVMRDCNLPCKQMSCNKPQALLFR